MGWDRRMVEPQSRCLTKSELHSSYCCLLLGKDLNCSLLCWAAPSGARHSGVVLWKVHHCGSPCRTLGCYFLPCHWGVMGEGFHFKWKRTISIDEELGWPCLQTYPTDLGAQTELSRSVAVLSLQWEEGRGRLGPEAFGNSQRGS